jgi:hypothetical protein
LTRAAGAAARGTWIATVLLAVLAASPAAMGCKAKASATQCDQLLERYATLVVREKLPDASTAQVQAEQQREKTEARGDDAFKNCSSEVSQAEFECAMRAATADALEKCLE